MFEDISFELCEIAQPDICDSLELYQVGIMYLQGDGEEKSIGKGIYLFFVSCQPGYARVQHSLGRYY